MSLIVGLNALIFSRNVGWKQPMFLGSVVYVLRSLQLIRIIVLMRIVPDVSGTNVIPILHVI
jgi:hypothetical protein